jgi:glutamate N-acetyltransferase/amino-acid N-acetyltransferase
MIAADGEGATKLLEIAVHRRADVRPPLDSRQVVVMSSLCRPPCSARMQLGRILCAIGYAEGGVRRNENRSVAVVARGRIQVCADGNGVPFSEQDAGKPSFSKRKSAWDIDIIRDFLRHRLGAAT